MSSTIKFLGVDSTLVDLTERKGSKIDRKSEYFTIADIAEEIGPGPAGPQGVQGPAGPQGALGPVGPAGLEWRGAWVSGTSYVADDAVGYGGASYFCISATSGTTTPNLDTTKWALLAAQGAQGQTGATGAQGPQGPQGPAGPSGTNAYKSYIAQIIPDSSSAITTNVLENTLGTTVALSWVSGKLRVTLGSSIMTTTNFYLNTSSYFGGSNYYITTPTPVSLSAIDIDSYKVNGTPAQGWAFGSRIYFEIRIYS